MPVLLIRHQVNDYDTWVKVFHEERETRRANGMQREHLYRDAANPDVVWVLLEWDDLFRARLFVKSDDLQEALARAGVTDRPDYWHLEEEHQPPT